MSELQEWRIMLGWAVDHDQMVVVCDQDWNPNDDWPYPPIHVQRLLILQPDPLDVTRITLPKTDDGLVKVEVVTP